MLVCRQVTSHPFTREGYTAGAYGGMVCTVQIIVRGDHQRVGDVSHALSGAVTGLQLIPQTYNTDTTEQQNRDNNTDEEQDNDTDNGEEQDTADVPSPQQQACPFTISDFDSSTDNTHEDNENKTLVNSGLSSDLAIHTADDKLEDKASTKTPHLDSFDFTETIFSTSTPDSDKDKTVDLDKTPPKQLLSPDEHQPVYKPIVDEDKPTVDEDTKPPKPKRRRLQLHLQRQRIRYKQL